MSDAFTEHRSLLFTIAYEMLGSVADVEDVLQESYLRWRAVDPATVEHPRAYLVRLVTRQALNHLRSVKARREQYVGAWLPEPIRTEDNVSERQRANRSHSARSRTTEPSASEAET